MGRRMNNIGLLIKMSRIQQNMKQITLAKGICSTSYLSKIENNQTVPSEEVLQLLLARLQLDFDELSTDDEEELVNNLFGLYKEAINARKKDLIQDKLIIISDKNVLFKEVKNYYLYNLYILRVKSIIDPSSIEVEKLLEGLDQMKDNFDSRQKFIFHTNYGLYYYQNKNYKKALINLEEALESISNFHIEDWELADFYNILSITYLLNNQILNTIEYANKSLKIYQDLFIFNRAIDCYIVIGIAKKRNLNFKHSEENFLLAKKIASELKITEQDSLIYSNLGSLMAVMGNSDMAIKYYFQSLESTVNIDLKLTTIFSIIQEFYKKKSISDVISWCKDGLKLINANNHPRLLSFTYHFNLYLTISSHSDNQEEIILETINYFDKIEDYRHAQKYSILLAEYYSENRKYKNSTIYFQKANIYLYKQKSLSKWEDL